MGQPERIRTLPYHEIEEITTLFLRENGNGRPVPRDCVNYQTYFLAAVMPRIVELTPILHSFWEYEWLERGNGQSILNGFSL